MPSSANTLDALSTLQPPPEARDKLLKRLARIEGQIRGVQRLINEAADCEKILQQMAASRKALDKTFIEMIACLMEACLEQADTSQQQSQLVRQLLSRYA